MYFVKSKALLTASCILPIFLTYANAASVTASTSYDPLVAPNTSSLYPVDITRTDPQSATVSWLTDMPKSPDPALVWGDHVRQYANVNANGASHSAIALLDGGFVQTSIGWQDTFSNQSGSSLNYKLNLELARMDFYMADPKPTNARTGFVADVLVNGVSVWKSAQTFTLQGPLTTLRNEGFDIGDAFMVDRLTTQAGYRHLGYRGQVDLGTFAAGQTATVTYRYSQFAFWEKHGCTLPCGTVYATTAETGINQQRIISAPVPEPESYALLLTGLGLVGAMTRRSKSTGK